MFTFLQVPGVVVSLMCADQKTGVWKWNKNSTAHAQRQQDSHLADLVLSQEEGQVQELPLNFGSRSSKSLWNTVWYPIESVQTFALSLILEM